MEQTENTEAGTHTSEWKPDNDLFGFDKDHSDYKKNINPNILGWAGDIYSRWGYYLYSLAE